MMTLCKVYSQSVHHLRYPQLLPLPLPTDDDKPNDAKLDDDKQIDDKPIDDKSDDGQPIATANDPMVPVRESSRLQYLQSPKGGQHY